MSGGKKTSKANRRRIFNVRERENNLNTELDNYKRQNEEGRTFDVDTVKARASGPERPRWTPPKQPVEPLPVLNCPYCDKPIKELSLAIADKITGQAVHFDCVLSRLSHSELLGPGESISYIGGGRFGIVQTNSMTQGFVIKKIFEWENKENRSDWRTKISDHYSVT